jgi:DNA-binding MarR family transcriptional regulator
VDAFILDSIAQKSKMNMRNLCDELHFPASTATRKIDYLYELGLVKRETPEYFNSIDDKIVKQIKQIKKSSK